MTRRFSIAFLLSLAGLGAGLVLAAAALKPETHSSAGVTGYYTFVYTQTAFSSTYSIFHLSGACAWGPTASGRTEAVRTDINALGPADPTGLTAGTATAMSIPLSWSGYGPEFRVIAKPGGYATAPSDTAGALVYDVTTDNVIATGMTASTTYYISVWAKVSSNGIDTFSAH